MSDRLLFAAVLGMVGAFLVGIACALTSPDAFVGLVLIATAAFAIAVYILAPAYRLLSDYDRVEAEDVSRGKVVPFRRGA